MESLPLDTLYAVSLSPPCFSVKWLKAHIQPSLDRRVPGSPLFFDADGVERTRSPRHYCDKKRQDFVQILLSFPGSGIAI